MRLNEHALDELLGAAFAAATLLQSDSDEWCGSVSAQQGRIWLGRHLADAAEVVAALTERRPPRWSVAMETKAALGALERALDGAAPPVVA